MKKLGVIEGFFGSAWANEARLDYAPFLKKVGGQFYIYAPKQDQNLRKKWRENWGPEFRSQLQKIKSHFHDHGLEFGVALSPFGLEKNLSKSDRESLVEKACWLEDLGIDILGVFFDDMPSTEWAAPTQIETLSLLESHFHKKIIFCPSYYSYDPILEKVFGKMPRGYWDEVRDGASPEVSLAWTGPKVISPEISRSHLKKVDELFKRTPFLWENLFANDGPRNCKFLKLKPFSGRERGVLEDSDGWGFNMMNQPFLSHIVFLASVKVLRENQESTAAFAAAVDELCPAPVGQFIKAHASEFLEQGLDKILPSKKEQYLRELSTFKDPFSSEIKDWLLGKYLVGSECLTD